MSLYEEAKERASADLAAARETELWARAVAATSKKIGKEGRERVLGWDKTDWALYHFGGGMAYRNWLRGQGFGERDFEIENLDNIYVELLKEAAATEGNGE